jgi:hypothetical protein
MSQTIVATPVAFICRSFHITSHSFVIVGQAFLHSFDGIYSYSNVFHVIPAISLQFRASHLAYVMCVK